MCRYHINVKEKCLVDGKTGEIMRPNCWDDLSALYSYMVSAGEQEQADDMIKEVFRGEKVISKMIAKYQGKTGNTGQHPVYHKKGKTK